MFNLFERKILIGSYSWRINWVDMDTYETGKFLLFETKSGKRSFKITNKALLTRTKDHPGYDDVILWVMGGPWPKLAHKFI